MAETASYVFMWRLQHSTSPYSGRETSSTALRIISPRPLPPVLDDEVSRDRTNLSAFETAPPSILHHTSAAVCNKCACAANGMTLAYEPMGASALCGPTGRLPEVDLRKSMKDGADRLQVVKPSPGFDFTSWSLATNAWIRQKAYDALFPHQKLVYRDVEAGQSLNSAYESVF